jgi:hypothetical protein
MVHWYSTYWQEMRSNKYIALHLHSTIHRLNIDFATLLVTFVSGLWHV